MSAKVVTRGPAPIARKDGYGTVPDKTGKARDAEGYHTKRGDAE